jgi:DNA-directed RNA polymerase subunit RPC12/RpoP
MKKRDFLKMLVGVGAASVAATKVSDPPQPVLPISAGYRCSTCGDHLWYLTGWSEVPRLGYTDAHCDRCNRTWRIQTTPVLGVVEISNASLQEAR